MPDMIDLMTKGIRENQPRVENAVNSLAGSINNSLVGAIPENFEMNLNGTVNSNFNSLGRDDFETKKQNNFSNLDIDTLTYAFKTALKDMTGKVILDDEKIGKFVIEKVEEAIY